MPTVAIIDGIKVQVYWDDHPPPHFHVEIGEDRAQIEIDSLAMLDGYLSAARDRKVVTWARPRRSQLLDAWMQCQADLHPGRIE